MRDEFLSLDGIIVPPATLELPRARALAGFAAGGATPYVHLIECRRAPADGKPSEVVVFEVEVERPQAPANDIRRRERLAAIFAPADASYPEVVSLRPDFPRVPHLNHTTREFPRSLCLYDRAWSEVAIRWTPAAFVERAREWLKLTATGSLHQDDQPLEQLLFEGGLRIILPADMLEDLEAEKPVTLDIIPVGGHDPMRNLLALRPQAERRAKTPPQFVATTLTARPQTHGIIRRTPATLEELHEFMSAGGLDLLAELRKRLKEWDDPKVRAAKLIIIVAFPLRRTADGPTERWDFWAFMTTKTVQDVGLAVGLWNMQGGYAVPLVGVGPDEGKRGADVPVFVVAPYLEFTRGTAAAANGLEPDSVKAVAVGAGALGSQVVTTLARSGFGTWTVVDEDDLLPHNLARHALIGEMVGHPKAHGLAYYLNTLYDQPAPAEGVVADVLSPKDQRDALATKYAAADVILDASASVPVARHLALDITSPARRVSVFLNPNGTDLVVLAEDRERALTLDALEAQYYRAAANDAALAGHLGAAPGRLRYGRTCRDITTTMPTHLVGMHAAIASQAVRQALAVDGATARVWRTDAATMAVNPAEIRIAPAERQPLGDWKLVLDEAVRSRLSDLRASKLPNETGGVLIGMYDLTRQIVYVVDTIPSPPDSAEWPTLYVRGSEGLLDQIRAVGERSGGQLEYVGEWHSHPVGCPPLPSADDITVFTWLTEHMADAGLPALMAIVGDGGGSSWFLGQIHPDTTWRFEC